MQDRARGLGQKLVIEPKPNPKLRKLQARARSLRFESGFGNIERELMAEMAAALGRSEAHVLAALDELRAISDALDELERATIEPPLEELARRVAEFNSARERCERRRWELIVHREALGFRPSEIVEQTYPIPAPRRVKRR
jgi:hypothetical protein